MSLLKFLPVVAAIALIVTGFGIFYMFRSRAMRALASRWGFHYIGPATPKGRNSKIRPPLPPRFSLIFRPSGRQITKVWNLIEGQQNGVAVLIFDSILGEGRSSAACTVIACRTEENPFGMVSSPDRLIQSHGWTVVHGVWFLWFPWTMGIKHIDRYMDKLRFGRFTNLAVEKSP